MSTTAAQWWNARWSKHYTPLARVSPPRLKAAHGASVPMVRRIRVCPVVRTVLLQLGFARQMCYNTGTLLREAKSLCRTLVHQRHVGAYR
jgi:hypothetical protein